MSSETQIVILGRGESCDLVFPHPSVSRRHAELAIEPDGSITIRDLGSAGGTFILRGKKEIRANQTELERTDRLRLGEHEISVRDVLGFVEKTHPLRSPRRNPSRRRTPE